MMDYYLLIIDYICLLLITIVGKYHVMFDCCPLAFYCGHTISFKSKGKGVRFIVFDV